MPASGLDREARLAAALRANLRRRKAQARARAALAEGETQPPAPAPGPDSLPGAISPHPEETAPDPDSRNLP